MRLFLLYFLISSALALESYQGSDYEADYWRCGSPMIHSLRDRDPDGLLNDPDGKLKLKASLIKISKSNIRRWKSDLGTLSAQEQQLYDKVQKLNVPIVHRTSVQTASILLSNQYPLRSPKKRNTQAATTPNIEQQFFGAYDCVFAAVGIPYGIDDYGPVIMKVKPKEGFSWGTMLTGYSFALYVLKIPLSADINGYQRRDFARMVVTNDQYEEGMAYQMIKHIREGQGMRGKGRPFDKDTIISELLEIRREDRFWEKVTKHRLAFFEAHYTDDVEITDLDWIQFRDADKATVNALSLPGSWFGGEDAFIQFFRRLK